jgi:hypothetical protein
MLVTHDELERILRDALQEPRAEGEGQEPEVNPLKAVIHHMTLMLSDFGKHEPECVCADDKTLHAADCKDCECGLADAINFGVEQSGLSLEPEPATPEEEERLFKIGKDIVDGLLSRAPEPSAVRGEEPKRRCMGGHYGYKRGDHPPDCPEHTSSAVRAEGEKPALPLIDHEFKPCDCRAGCILRPFGGLSSADQCHLRVDEEAVFCEQPRAAHRAAEEGGGE